MSYPNWLKAIFAFIAARLAALRKQINYLRDKLDEHLVRRQLTFAQLSLQAIRFVLNRHEILSRASAIAYGAMLAFLPFITLVITATALFLPDLAGAGRTAKDLAFMLGTIFPTDVTNLILDQLQQIQKQPTLPVLGVTLLLAIWTATSLYSEIINSLNRILGVSESRPYWRLQLTSASLALMQAVVLTTAFVAVVAWPHLVQFLGLSGWTAGLATILQWCLLFGVLHLSFAIVFHFGPANQKGNKKLTHWVSPGATFGTIVFLLATSGFRFYLEHFANYRTAYGSLGGLMMLMVWLWVMSLVLLISAEINKLAALAEGKKP